ncbi:unnamed protein product [Amaranthus hypochondriacus]
MANSNSAALENGGMQVL